ncbi:MAG: citrate/2-methylcitrate synthase [Halobacteria archaeon]|nr:citrate/2-methylcitrate synthase [Halobacteria archaeon]
MLENEPVKRVGLDNIVVADSTITYIDGEKPELIYRGYDVQDLAERSTYEEVVYLLWFGELPTSEELEEFKSDLVGRRGLSDETVQILELISEDGNPMEVLRTAVSSLPASAEFSVDTSEASRDEFLELGKSLVAKIPTIIANYDRLSRGLDTVEPRDDLDHSANFLYMLDGDKDEPSEDRVEVLDAALVLHADHGMNASTFTSRVITSTGSDPYSAIVGAISALKGYRHGGANQDVMEMLESIEGDPVEHVETMLDNGERVPGFGHRVYQTMDPRAVVLKETSRRLSESWDGRDYYGMSTQIQEYMESEKGIAPNVDFYSASTYRCLGVPTNLFTPMFAMGRIAGWMAQVLEQKEDNRLIRPRADYKGERDKEYVPIEER